MPHIKGFFSELTKNVPVDSETSNNSFNDLMRNSVELAVMDYFHFKSIRYFVIYISFEKGRFVRVKTSHILNLIILLKLTRCERGHP